MLALGICIAITVFDQWSKFLIWQHFQFGERRVVIDGLFNLTYVGNTGAAWGVFQHQNGMLAVLSLVVFVLLLVFRRSIMRGILPQRISLGLLLGGIMGNCLDRLRLNHVVDFLDFYWRGYHFPSFNVADSAICIGVALYILSELPYARRRPAAQEPDDGPGPAQS